jgi:anti-anti-sigma factor
MPGDGHVLTVSVRDLGEAVILGGQGRIVRGSETAILCAAVQQHGRNVILDLSQVDAIDGAGVGALVALQAAGIYLRLVSANQKVRDVLRDTALESVFEICETLTGEAMEESNPQDQSRGLVASGAGVKANR